MQYVQIVINACSSILNYHINLCGYYVSLMGVMIFVCLGSLILFFVYRLFW